MEKSASKDFDRLVALASEWVAEQEQLALAVGLPLGRAQLDDARAVGVCSPEKIRLLAVTRMPFPKHPALVAAARMTGLLSSRTLGITFGYGILVQEEYFETRSLVVHECVHVMQYERLGGIPQFLREYLLECLTPPAYPFGPLEQEAIRLQVELCT
jgi:hypothetical protein